MYLERRPFLWLTLLPRSPIPSLPTSTQHPTTSPGLHHSVVCVQRGGHFFFICLHIWKGSRSIRWGWSLLKNSSGDLQWAEVWNFRKKEWMSQWKGEHSNRLQQEWAGLGSSLLSTTAGVQGCSWVDAVKDTRVPDMDIFSDPRGPCWAFDFYSKKLQPCLFSLLLIRCSSKIPYLAMIFCCPSKISYLAIFLEGFFQGLKLLNVHWAIEFIERESLNPWMFLTLSSLKQNLSSRVDTTVRWLRWERH